MRAFEYANPTSIQEAVRLLGSNEGESAVLAGGTDLLSLMKDYVVTPGRLVNIKSIEDLQGVSYDSDSGLSIGAVVTLDELAAQDSVRTHYPALIQALDGIRSAQIQAAGTVGGDLCQRPRCWYFRRGFGLLAQMNGKSMVSDGDNRYHAILGNDGPAQFVNASSLAPALIALGAKVTIQGVSGSREVDLEDFFQTPGSQGERENVLVPNEILTRIVVPAASGTQNATYEVREKEALDWPLTAASVALTRNGGGVGTARVVLGHVAPVPWVSEKAAMALQGKAVSRESAESAGDAAVEGARALSRNKYKIQLARVAVKRAVLRAAGMEES